MATCASMTISLSIESLVSIHVDLLAVGVSGKNWLKDPTLLKLDRACDGALLTSIKQEEWKAKAGDTFRLNGRGRLKAKRLLLVGLGDDELTLNAQRLMAVKAVRELIAKGSSLALPFIGNSDSSTHISDYGNSIAIPGPGIDTPAPAWAYSAR